MSGSERGDNATGLPLAAAAQQFFEGGGPDLATEQVPWLVDIMPVSNWLYAVTAVSVLFNVIGYYNRARLRQIDTERLAVEARLPALFGPGITPAAMARVAVTPEHRTAEHRAQVTELIDTLEALRARCRQHSLSWTADTGQEMPYRYQEHLMAELQDALRHFRDRVDEPEGAAVRERTLTAL